MNKLYKALLTLFISTSVFGAEKLPSDFSMAELGYKLQKSITTNQAQNLRDLLIENVNVFDINKTCLNFIIGTGIKNSHGRWIRKKCNVTLLIFAACYAKPDIIRKLIQSGADTNIGIEIDDNIFYPLTIAYMDDDNGYTTLKDLFLVTQEFINAGISSDHKEQALKFFNEFIESNIVSTDRNKVVNQEWAERIRNLFD